jgi:hypothetical protein
MEIDRGKLFSLITPVFPHGGRPGKDVKSDQSGKTRSAPNVQKRYADRDRLRNLTETRRGKDIQTAGVSKR